MKTNYLKPAIKIVAVNVERGYAASVNDASIHGFTPKDPNKDNKNSIWG